MSRKFSVKEKDFKRKSNTFSTNSRKNVSRKWKKISTYQNKWFSWKKCKCVKINFWPCSKINANKDWKKKGSSMKRSSKNNKSFNNMKSIKSKESLKNKSGKKWTSSIKSKKDNFYKKIKDAQKSMKRPRLK